MFAYIVNDIHIATIVKNYAELSTLDAYDQQLVANLLMKENIRSVNYRCGENTEYTPCDMTEWRKVTPAEALSLIDCLDYQSCETDSWKETLAYHLLTLMMRTFERVQDSPQRSDKLWSI